MDAPTDAATLLASLDPSDIERRLAELDRERQALMILLRATRRKNPRRCLSEMGGRQ